MSELGLAKESEYINVLVGQIKNENIRDRVENIVGWYHRRAKVSKVFYYILSATSITCSAVIPVISLTEWKDANLAVASVAAVSGICTSFSALFYFKDNWQRYRAHVESIKSECFQYICKIGEYQGGNADELFAMRLERVAMKENSEWLKMNRGKKTDEERVGIAGTSEDEADTTEGI